ncbi:MAG: DNA polymerase I [Pirellulales bacterium]|nr:DNA polymerase I [Pirellulales bacterium]
MTDRPRQISLPGFEPEEEPPAPPDHGEPSPLVLPESATPPPENLEGRTVWVIDSHSLIHQVFHALPEMTSPRGEPVGAVFGFTRDVLYLLGQKRPDYLFCAFDLPGKTFRHEMYDRYKIQRAEMPDDLVPQISSIRRVIHTLGVPALGCESFEADDVLATVARIADERGGQCFLVTADKDCRQLIGDRVRLYNIRKDQVFDREALQKDWGIAPSQVVDFQALVGDSVDNVPGVPLIGPKLARELLQKYHTLDAVLDHAHEVSGKKRKENLVNYRRQAELSRDLVRLDVHVPVPIDWSGGRVGGVDRDAAQELFFEFGFRTMGRQLETLGFEPRRPKPPSTVKADYRLVDSPAALQTLVAELQQQKCISLDTETTSVRPRFAEIVGYSFAWRDDQAWYLPVRAPVGESCLEPKATLEALRPVLEDPTIEKVGQNLKYDMMVLRSAGIELAGVAFDTMVADYLLEAGRRSHGLDELSLRYLDHETIKISELIGTGKKQKRMDEVPVSQVTDYAAEDALLPLRLRPILARQLVEAEADKLFAELELPLIEVLVELEYNGIRVDVDRLADLSRRYGRRIEQLQEEIYELAGHPLNIASPRQLQEVLFTELGLPVVKKTAKTGPSTDADVLEELARVHPLPAKILEFRQYAKLKSTYVDALPEMVHPETGRLHASFNQVVTATGRLSSSDPNLQNIPVRTETGREIRSAFVPDPEGWTLLAADYSQIELRVLAHFSGDRQLCEAFARDEDIHARVAGQVNDVPLEEVTPAMRRVAKAVNFGVIYGQSPFGLSRTLGIDQDEAARFIDSYFAGYPGIEEFLAGVLAQCRQTGYVSTILGRRRAIRGIREHAGRQRNLAERTAVNTVIQGSAADLIKLAMVAIHRRLKRERLPARMLLQIHDELIFEVPSDQLHNLATLVIEEMVGVAKLRVPLKVDIKAGPNWADAKPFGD